MRRTCLAASAYMLATLATVHAATHPAAAIAAGLLPVRVQAAEGRILLTLPAPDESGTAGRFLYATSLKTGLGSARITLDHGMLGETHILAFRRLGRKVAVTFENPRYRAAGAPEIAKGARESFPFSTVVPIRLARSLSTWRPSSPATRWTSPAV